MCRDGTAGSNIIQYHTESDPKSNTSNYTTGNEAEHHHPVSTIPQNARSYDGNREVDLTERQNSCVHKLSPCVNGANESQQGLALKAAGLQSVLDSNDSNNALSASEGMHLAGEHE
jgi:hypothetical protein